MSTTGTRPVPAKDLRQDDLIDLAPLYDEFAPENTETWYRREYVTVDQVVPEPGSDTLVRIEHSFGAFAVPAEHPVSRVEILDGETYE